MNVPALEELVEKVNRLHARIVSNTLLEQCYDELRQVRKAVLPENQPTFVTNPDNKDA